MKREMLEKHTFDLAIKSHFQNDLKNAEIQYKKVLDINPNNLSACNNLGIILTNLNNIKDAEKYYLKAIKINPNYADANYNIAGLYKSTGKIHDSIRWSWATVSDIWDKLHGTPVPVRSKDGNYVVQSSLDDWRV